MLCKKEGQRGDWKIGPLQLSNLTAASSVRQAVLSLRALLENSEENWQAEYIACCVAQFKHDEKEKTG